MSKNVYYDHNYFYDEFNPLDPRSDLCVHQKAVEGYLNNRWPIKEMLDLENKSPLLYAMAGYESDNEFFESYDLWSALNFDDVSKEFWKKNIRTKVKVKETIVPVSHKEGKYVLFTFVTRKFEWDDDIYSKAKLYLRDYYLKNKNEIDERIKRSNKKINRENPLKRGLV